MRALLWKDYRLNRGLLLLGMTLLLGPYAVVTGWAVYGYWPSLPEAAMYVTLLGSASYGSLALSQLTLVLLAGNVIACERVDRSADFLAYLPPSRLRILASKFLLALLLVAVVWAVNLGFFYLIAPAVAPLPGDVVRDFPSFCWSMVTTSVMLFGAGWLGSALLDSPAIATSLGIGATLIVPFLPMATAHLFGWPAVQGRDELQAWCLRACLVVGSLCFLSGSAYYLRRVEP